MSKQVFVAVPMEKAISEYAVNALLQVAAHCGKRGYRQILWPCQRVDVARNNIVKLFLESSTDDDDTLVMLDADHTHPPDTVERLVAHDVGVVGALAFTRGAPYMPCFFLRVEGAFRAVTDWEGEGLMPVDAVGTGAIAIKRSVFKALDGEGGPCEGGFFFQCVYPATMNTPTPSEDMWFATCCYMSGIKHHIDTSLVIPHLMMATVDESYFRAHQAQKVAQE